MMNTQAMMANVCVGPDSKSEEGSIACQTSCSLAPNVAALLPLQRGLAAKTDHMKAGFWNICG